MAKQKKPKPTMKDVTEALDQMMSNMNWLKNNLDMVGRLFDLYVESKGDTDNFKKYLDKVQKEYEEAKKKEESANEQTEDGQSNDQNSEDSSTDKE